MGNSHIVTFGCPRAGTSYIQKALTYVPAVHVYKLREDNPLHPSKSNMGLIGLARMITDHLVFVRIKRNPMEIVESFVATRSAVRVGGTLHLNTDEKIVEWVVSESEGTHYQRQSVEYGSRKGQIKWRFVEVRYESLVTEQGVSSFCNEVYGHIPEACSLEAMKQYILKSFGNRRASVMAGRLSQGVVDSVLSEEQKVFFKERLAAVAIIEGYSL